MIFYVCINEYKYSTQYKKNRYIILNKAKDCYKNNKDRLSKQTRDKQNNLPEEKDRKREYRRNQHYNITEEEKKNNMKEIDINICQKKKQIKKENIQEIDIMQ